MTGINRLASLPRIFLATPFRLSAVYVSLFCAAVALTFIYVYVNLQEYLSRQAEIAVQADYDALREQFRQGGAPALVAAVAERSAPSGNALYLLTDGAGHRLAGNLEAVSADLWNNPGIVSFAYRQNGADGRSRRHEAFGQVALFPGNLHLVIARNVDDQESVKKLMRRGFLWGYGFIVFIGFTGGFLVSKRILNRMDEVSNTARAIMRGNLAERIPLSPRHDEFDRLSENLNAMLDRIQDLMAGLKDVSDNIAHDLKTPLHRLRTRAEQALKANASREGFAEALAGVIEEADGLMKTFDALLNIARLEAGARAENFGPLNLCAVIRDVVDLYEPVCEEIGLPLHFDCGADISIAGEKHLIVQALTNLIDNAIKYAATPSQTGATASIEISLKDHGDSVDVLVADRGPGIPEKDRERVLQRFVRLQPSRSIPGSGLGLSLVAAVARLHGGSVSIENNDPGLRVRLRLKKNMPQKEEAQAGQAIALNHAV